MTQGELLRVARSIQYGTASPAEGRPCSENRHLTVHVLPPITLQVSFQIASRVSDLLLCLTLRRDWPI